MYYGNTLWCGEEAVKAQSLTKRDALSTCSVFCRAYNRLLSRFNGVLSLACAAFKLVMWAAATRVSSVTSTGRHPWSCPSLVRVLPIAGIREDAFCLLGLIASKRVRPEICPPFVRVLPVIITRRLPFTFFVSQVVLLILHPFLADVTHTEHAWVPCIKKFASNTSQSGVNSAEVDNCSCMPTTRTRSVDFCDVIGNLN